LHNSLIMHGSVIISAPRPIGATRRGVPAVPGPAAASAHCAGLATISDT